MNTFHLYKESDQGNFLISFLFFGPFCAANRILVPWPEIKSAPPAVEAQSLNHWINREVPGKNILIVLWGFKFYFIKFFKVKFPYSGGHPERRGACHRKSKDHIGGMEILRLRATSCALRSEWPSWGEVFKFGFIGEMFKFECLLFRQNGYVFPMLANGLFALKIIFSEVAGECIT